MKNKLLLFFTLIVLVASCTSKEDIRTALVNDSTILTDAIKANPTQFLTALQLAANEAKKQAAVDAKKKQENELQQSIDKPLIPSITKADTIRGNKNAPLVLVEYSDFQCPYCARGYNTINQLKARYGDKLQVVYKHLPLSFHAQAKIAAQYYEALALQSPEKAFKFHDAIYENQAPLGSEGEKYLIKLAKKVNANMKKLKIDINSPKVLAKIDADTLEAQKFGMSGTPGFLINGVPVRGAYPESHFVQIINNLVDKKKVKL